jgi:RNA polymerase sigma-70 factor (ECF subfamily)
MAEGDAGACAALYDESSGLTFSLMLHILQNHDAAEDALLHLYLQVRLKARSYAHRTHDPAVWLLDLARSTALARVRPRPRLRNRTRVAPLDTAQRASVVPFEPVHRESQPVSGGAAHGSAVNGGGLSELTHEQRSILQMTYFGGLSAREAADELGVPFQRVTREIQRAMEVLRSTRNATDVIGMWA